MRFAVFGSFDSLNQYTYKGDPAVGVGNEKLQVPTAYGRLDIIDDLPSLDLLVDLLDLPLAKMIIHKHQGLIDLARQEPDGLILKISLPHRRDSVV